MAKLNENQKRFVREYLIDLNATAAAKRAGYSEKTAHAQGGRLLKHVKISAAIKRGMDKRAERTKMNADEVLREFARLARSDITNYLKVGRDGVEIRDFENLTEDETRAVAEVKETFSAQGQRQIKIKLHDKIKALENLAKHLGLLIERHEVKVLDWATIARNATDGTD